MGEGEKVVLGEWIGEGAEALGLSGEVTDEPFEALRRSRDPNTGIILTALDDKYGATFIEM